MSSTASENDGAGIDCLPIETVEKEITVRGSVGRYTGGVNENGRPHGEGSFVREGLTYVGVWKVSRCLRQFQRREGARILMSLDTPGRGACRRGRILHERPLGWKRSLGLTWD